MKKVILCSMLLVCFSISAERKKVDMSRIEKELLIARERLSVSEKRNEQARPAYEKSYWYKNFHKEYEECSLAKNCEKNLEFLAAQAELISSDAYAFFSPIHNQFIYDQLKHHGLEKMVNYVRFSDVGGGDDIEAMRIAVDSALHVDTHGNLTPETALIRDKVERELLDLIALEDSSSGAERIE